MNVHEFEAAAKAKIASLTTAVKDFFEAHADLESDAANVLKNAADDAAPLIETAVEAAAPPSVADALDAAIAKVQSDADEAAAKIQADAQARIQALQDAKATTAA